MSTSAFQVITYLLAGCMLVALAAIAFSFIAMIVRWKSPQRKGHVVRLLLAIAAVPCLIAIQQAVLWWVYLPSLGREQMARANAAREARLAESSLVNVGDSAPDFSLATIDGETFALSEARGDVVLINFFATWCGPCRLELPHIEQIWTEHRGNENFRLLVIGREESTESARAYREEHGFSFPVAADPERAVFSLFAEDTIPRTLVVSPEGKIVYSQIGFREEDLASLHEVLADQLALANQ